MKMGGNETRVGGVGWLSERLANLEEKGKREGEDGGAVLKGKPPCKISLDN